MVVRNLKLTIEYDGLSFSGWQAQSHKRTIQQAIEEVLHRITREKIRLIGASRTDAGVHALGQVANFKTRHPIPCNKLTLALNGLLPPSLSIREVREVPLEFHATKDAQGKVYRYFIWNSPTRSALMRDRVWHVYDPLDLQAMRQGSRAFLGRHDFSAFRGTRSDTKTSVRTIHQLTIDHSLPLQRGGLGWGQVGGEFLCIEVSGDGFLKYMVRNMVGTLVDVGKGRIEPGEVKKILQSRDRKKAGRTAPAYGLYLVSVRYP